MTLGSITFGAVQVVAGITLAPLLPGLIQHWKARLQGRRGPSPVQPYRELRRLWHKSIVAVEGTTAVYQTAPAIAAAALATALLLIPITAVAPNLGVGHDAVALIGLLALSRFVMAASCWDVSNGFSLMGASRDLTISVFVEITLILSLTIVALVADTTDLTGMIAATAGTQPWSNPALGLGAVAFAFVVIAETGRQPVDNPDTHLELTMIHESPLLEYAGRDLMFLQWTAAARHWVVLLLGAELFLPHGHNPWLQLGELVVVLVVACAALAVTETVFAKIRVLLVPRMLLIAASIALLGIAAELGGSL